MWLCKRHDMWIFFISQIRKTIFPSDLLFIFSITAFSLNNNNWAHRYKVPELPSSLKHQLLAGSPLDTPQKYKLARLITADCFKLTARPIKKELEQVAKVVVDAFPDSLQDRVSAPSGFLVVGTGSDSFLKILRSRVENQVRGKNNTELKRRLAAEPPAAKRKAAAKHHADSYGCVRYAPELPDGESIESLQEVSFATCALIGSSLIAFLYR